MKRERCVICGKTYPYYLFDNPGICVYCTSLKIFDYQPVVYSSKRDTKYKKSSKKHTRLPNNNQ